MKKMQLHIPEPCHENWDNMAPTEQGRYCNACAKQVIDFTSMSDTELLNYFSKLKNESVCGRAYTDQLERKITMPPKRKWLWYWNYVIAFFLLFSKSNAAKAQGKIKTVNTVVNKIPVTTSIQMGNAASNNYNFKGKVVDEKGKPVSFASIRIIGTKIGTATDTEGNFNLLATDSNCSITVSAVGMVTTKVILNKTEGNIITVKNDVVMLQGVVVNTTSVYKVGGMRMVSCGLTVNRRKKIKDTIKTWVANFNPSIKVYPNPVHKGNSFMAELNLKSAGLHQIKIFDAAGRLLLLREVNVTAKQCKEIIATNSNWASGVYFIHVLNEKKKVLNSSFVIE